jgi:cellobiose transport system substrate-binding protein
VRSSAKYNFMTPDGKYIGDHDHVREQWEIACRFAKDRLTAAGVGSDQSALLTNGRMSSMIAAAWSESDLKASAPKTAGKWRVCRPPNGGGNNGGSYLAVTRYARDPKAAFAFIRWLQSPDNQMQAYEEMALFPSALSALDSRRLDKPDDFFDGQHATRVFAASAKDVPQAYVSPYDALINGSFNFELANVESGGKSPERAWRDAQHRIERDLTRIGVI